MPEQSTSEELIYRGAILISVSNDGEAQNRRIWSNAGILMLAKIVDCVDHFVSRARSTLTSGRGISYSTALALVC